MKKTQLLFLIVIGIFLSFSSCKKNKKGDNIGTNQSSNPAVLDLGSNINAKFFARIIDEDGNAIEDALVAIGNKTASTDENGIVIIENASVKEKIAYMTVVKSGYFLGSRSVIAQTTGTNEIRITLLTKKIIATINSGSASTVTTTSGLKIDFEGEYVNEDGTLYDGDVNVAIKHIDPTDDDFSNQMPGSLYAQNEENNEGVLESYGMAAIEISSPSGDELQIANGSKATLHMPISDAQIDNAPSTLPLWHFDEEAGYWIQEGEASLVNGEYVGEVQHFSFWNCDAFYDDAQIQGSIVDGSGNTISNASVQIVTPNATILGQVGTLGVFYSYVPANVAVTFNVFDACGNQLTTWTNTFATNSNVSHNFTVSSSNLSTIAGTLVDCNITAVTNGYLHLTIGSNSYYPTITNGVFNVTLGNCIANTSFTIEGYDFNSTQSTGILLFTTTNPVTNIGNIIACTSASEYIAYTIDNNPATALYAPISCQEYQDSLNPAISTLNIGANSGNYWFNLTIEGNTIGGYNFMNFGTTIPGASLTITQYINTTGGYPNILFNLNTHGAVDTYTDVTFSGTYLDQNNVSHTISGNLHVLRDS